MKNQAKKKKIVCINILSTRGGGGTTYVKKIIPEIIKSGMFEFTVIVSSKYQKEIISEISEYNVDIFDSRISSSLIIRMLWEQIIMPIHLKKLKCDIFYQVTESCPMFAPCPVVINARNAIILTPWNKIKSYSLFLKKAMNLPMALFAFKKADRIICVSNFIKEIIKDKHNSFNNKLRVVNHGVSYDFKPVKNTTKSSFSPYLLTVSDLMPHKNYETLIKAFHLYLKINPNSPLQLLIAGKQNNVTYSYVKDIIAKYNIDKRIHFMDSVEYKDLPSLYRHAEIFIFPSRIESFGIPLLEAMASGLPVLASDIPACREVCQDAAIYFNYDDSDALAAGIQFLQKNRNACEKIKSKAIKRASKFSWRNTASGLLEIFNEVI